MVVQPGDVVEVRFTKWGGARHWEFPMTVLGTDDHGVWAGAAVGTRLWRPAAQFTSAFDWVTLIPHHAPWAASFYDAPDQPVRVYVDMTTPASWEGTAVRLVDLDLDVVLGRDGSLFIDDEDEFAAHQVALAYPDEIVDLARCSAQEVFAAITDCAEPFRSAGAGWLRTWRRATHPRS